MYVRGGRDVRVFRLIPAVSVTCQKTPPCSSLSSLLSRENLSAGLSSPLLTTAGSVFPWACSCVQLCFTTLCVFTYVFPLLKPYLQMSLLVLALYMCMCVSVILFPLVCVCVCVFIPGNRQVLLQNQISDCPPQSLRS